MHEKSILEEYKTHVACIEQNQFSTSKCREILRFIRLNNVVDPKVVVAACDYLLPRCIAPSGPTSFLSSLLGTCMGQTVLPLQEYYSILEQYFIALLQSDSTKSAEKILRQIELRFPRDSSRRTMRLVGMLHEAQGELEEAETLYSTMIGKHPANVLVQKRRVAVALARGREREAVQLLNECLKTFSGDIEAWVELAELHVAAKRWEYALFCFEELILLAPDNAQFYTRAAECLLREHVCVPNDSRQKQQWYQSLVAARQYAATAVKISGKLYGRGLWALACATAAIASAAQESRSNEPVLNTSDLSAGDVVIHSLLNYDSKHEMIDCEGAAKDLSETSSKGDDFITSCELIKEFTKKDLNAALFTVAWRGLAQSYQLEAKRIKQETHSQSSKSISDISIPIEVCGSWQQARQRLAKFSKRVAEAAQSGATSASPFTEPN